MTWLLHATAKTGEHTETECETCRAATLVATRIGVWPEPNDFSACSRSDCDRSPWIDVAGYPCLREPECEPDHKPQSNTTQPRMRTGSHTTNQIQPSKSAMTPTGTTSGTDWSTLASS